MDGTAALIVAVVLVLLVLITLARTVRIVPQARAGIVERLGRYQRTLNPGLSILVPFVDRLRPLLDMREQVVSFPPQPVITEDNLVVNIDSVIYFQVTDPKSATYEIASFLMAIEQLTVTTLRNVIGSMDLEETLTSRDSINAALRGVLDEATGKWGIRVNRVELKAIDPPISIKESMEKQMRAERDKRAAILNAEGSKQAAILNAEGQKTAAVLTAEGQAQAAVLRAQGEAAAIAKVFGAIHAGNPTEKVLAYQYLQALPAIAQGTANKVWIVPAELSSAMQRLGTAFSGTQPGGASVGRGSSVDDDADSTSADAGPAAAAVTAGDGAIAEIAAAAQMAAGGAVADAVAASDEAAGRPATAAGAAASLAAARRGDSAKADPGVRTDADATTGATDVRAADPSI